MNEFMHDPFSHLILYLLNIFGLTMLLMFVKDLNKIDIALIRFGRIISMMLVIVFYFGFPLSLNW